jgi:hypothetical protein
VEEAGTVPRGGRSAQMVHHGSINGGAPAGAHQHQHSNGARPRHHHEARLPLPFMGGAASSSPSAAASSAAAHLLEASQDPGDDEEVQCAGHAAGVKTEKRQVVRKSKGRWTKQEVRPLAGPCFPRPP